MPSNNYASREQVRDAVALKLHQGEEFISFTFARIPFRNHTQQGTTFASIAGLLLLLDLFLWKWRQSKALKRASDAGYSMSPHIYFVATSERFVYLKASGLRKYVGNVLGDIPRSAIGSVSLLPYIGDGRWKTLILTGRKGGGMRFVVPRVEGEAFVSEVAMPPERVEDM